MLSLFYFQKQITKFGNRINQKKQKIRKLLTLLISFLITATSFAQIETKVALKAPSKLPKEISKAEKKEIYIGNFAIAYSMQKQRNAETSEAKLLLRHRVEIDLTKDEAMVITNAGYNYLKEELAKVGFDVKVYNTEDVKATRTYQKKSKKSTDASVTDGGPYFFKPKDINQWKIGTWAKGVTAIYLGSGAGGIDYAGMNCELGGKEGKLVLNIDGEIEFIDWNETSKTTGNNVNVSLLSTKDLQLNGNGYSSTYSHYTTTKPVQHYLGGAEYHFTDNNWVSGEVKKDEDVTIWNLDKQKYHDACLALIKAYCDDIVKVVKASME